MSFDACNRLLKIWESIKTPTPKVGVHLGVEGFIPSHFPTFPKAWNFPLGFHSWPALLLALALVLNPRLGLRQWGPWCKICFAFEYDAKVVIPQFITCFDQLNPISQACITIINVPNFQFEEGNTFSVEASMEEFFRAFVVKELYLFKRLSILTFACVDPRNFRVPNQNWVCF